MAFVMFFGRMGFFFMSLAILNTGAVELGRKRIQNLYLFKANLDSGTLSPAIQLCGGFAVSKTSLVTTKQCAQTYLKVDRPLVFNAFSQTRIRFEIQDIRYVGHTTAIVTLGNLMKTNPIGFQIGENGPDFSMKTSAERIVTNSSCRIVE